MRSLYFVIMNPGSLQASQKPDYWHLKNNDICINQIVSQLQQISHNENNMLSANDMDKTKIINGSICKQLLPKNKTMEALHHIRHMESYKAKTVFYAPRVIEQSQKTVQNAWTTSALYFNKSIVFLQKEVFVGKLAPENVQKVVIEAFNTTQKKASEYYHWLYDQIVFYAPRLIEQSQKTVQNAWTTSALYFNKSIVFLQKEVFVGKLAPENVQKVVMEALNMTQQKASEYYHWVYEKMVEFYAPGMIEQSQKPVQNAWTTSALYLYLNKSIVFLQTEVFVGKLAPENVQKVVIEALNTTQQKASEYYHWVYEKMIEFYTQGVTEQSQKPVQNAWTTSVLYSYFDKSIVFLQKEVFVGNLAPEKVQKVVIEALKTTQQKASEYYHWVYEKMIEFYTQGVTEQSQKPVQNAWTTSVLYSYFDKSIVFLQKEVFVGNLAPEKVQKVVVEALKTTQQKTSEYYHWVYEKIEFYAQEVTEQYQKPVQTAWTTSALYSYFNKSIVFLQKEVFVGKLAPENVQKVVIDALKTTQQKASEYYHWMYEKMIEFYVQGVTEQSQKHVQNAWTTSVLYSYFDNSIVFLQKEVFVGNLALENVQKVLIEAINTVQQKASEYYHWVYEKVRSLA